MGFCDSITRMIIILVSGFVFVVMGFGGVVVLADEPVIEVGEPFPDIVLPALADGGARRVSDYRGHKLILHVFASW